MPAKAGIHKKHWVMDSRLRGNDPKTAFCNTLPLKAQKQKAVFWHALFGVHFCVRISNTLRPKAGLQADLREQFGLGARPAVFATKTSPHSFRRSQ